MTRIIVPYPWLPFVYKFFYVRVNYTITVSYTHLDVYKRQGRGVLNRYKTLADSQGWSYGVIGRMSDGEIESFLQLSKQMCIRDRMPTGLSKRRMIRNMRYKMAGLVMYYPLNLYRLLI